MVVLCREWLHDTEVTVFINLTITIALIYLQVIHHKLCFTILVYILQLTR